MKFGHRIVAWAAILATIASGIPGIEHSVAAPPPGRARQMLFYSGSPTYNFAASPVYTMRQGLAIALVPQWSYGSAAESAGTQPITLARTLGSSLVGTMDDYSPSPHYVYADSSGSRPTLSADGAWTFSGSQSLTIVESTKSLKFLHNTAVFHLFVWVKPANVVGTKAILESTNDVETTNGLMLRIDNANLTIKLTDGTSPPAGEVALTSAFAANTWTLVEVVGEGVGSNKLKAAVNGGAYTTATVSNTLASGDASYSMKIGNKASVNGNRFSGDIGPLFIWNKNLTTAERATFIGWGRPAPTTSNPYTYTGGAITNASHARNLYLMSDSTYVRKSGDVAVSSDLDQVDTVKHANASLFAYDPKRDMTLSAGATNPEWRTSANTGLLVGGVRFNDGITTSDSLTMATAMRRTYEMTRVFVVANHKTATLETSHVIREAGTSSSYMAITPDGYAGGGSNNPRFSYHDQNGYGPDGGADLGFRNHDHFNVIVVTRVGSTYYSYVNGVLTSAPTGGTGGVAFNTLGGSNSSPDTSYSPWATWVLCAELPWCLSASQISALNVYYTTQFGIQ